MKLSRVTVYMPIQLRPTLHNRAVALKATWLVCNIWYDWGTGISMMGKKLSVLTLDNGSIIKLDYSCCISRRWLNRTLKYLSGATTRWGRGGTVYGQIKKPNWCLMVEIDQKDAKSVLLVNEPQQVSSCTCEIRVVQSHLASHTIPWDQCQVHHQGGEWVSVAKETQWSDILS
jgi:hypothetical protein